MLTIKKSEIETRALIAIRRIHEQYSRLSNQGLEKHASGLSSADEEAEFMKWQKLASQISSILDAKEKEISVPIASIALIHQILEIKGDIQHMPLAA